MPESKTNGRKRNIVGFEPCGPVAEMIRNELRAGKTKTDTMEELIVKAVGHKYPKLLERYQILKEEAAFAYQPLLVWTAFIMCALAAACCALNHGRVDLLIGFGCLALMLAVGFFGRKYLLLGLVAFGLTQHSAKAQTVNDLPQDVTHTNQVVVEVVCGVIIIGGGAVIVYELRKFCKTHFPPGTNAPPVPPAPRGTNGFTAPLAGASPTVTINAGEDGFFEGVITNTGPEFTAPNRSQYKHWYQMSFTPSDSPTCFNAANKLTVTIWVSSSYVLTILVKGGEIIQQVEAERPNGSEFNIAIPCDLGCGNEAARFYKLEAQ